MQTRDIELEPTTVGERGQRFRVHYAGGVLIESTPDPERDACRALIALGITGTLHPMEGRQALVHATQHRARRSVFSQRDRPAWIAVSAVAAIHGGGRIKGLPHC